MDSAKLISSKSYTKTELVKPIRKEAYSKVESSKFIRNENNKNVKSYKPEVSKPEVKLEPEVNEEPEPKYEPEVNKSPEIKTKPEVNNEPEVESEPEDEEEEEAPEVKMMKSELMMSEGDTITLTCHVTGKPMPNVVWRRGMNNLCFRNKYLMQIYKKGK